MRIFTIMQRQKMKKQVRREESKKQEQLIAEYMQRLDKHGFHVRTHWPD